MRICYVQLSPTFGMHQYASDLANRMAQAGHDVHLVTTTRVPGDRYLGTVKVHAPVTLSNTGFSRESLGWHNLRRVYVEIKSLQAEVVHFTGPHLWNAVLVWALAKKGVAVVHTLHDLDPHSGMRYGFLLRIWNQLILRWSKHILVHGEIYRERLLIRGFSPGRVTFTPLLHLFLSPVGLKLPSAQLATSIQYQAWTLFFGRLERYKGVDHLLTAAAMMKNVDEGQPQVILAGLGDLSTVWAGPLPPNVEVRNRLIPDEEAIDLFRRCAFVVLPYIDATQSALVAAAYYFRKPVVVTRTGALPEYVEDGQTGRVVEPGHPASLARCLDDMLSDPIRLAQMGAAGRTWYDAYREIEMTTLLEMYREVTKSHAASSEHKMPLSPTALKQN
jgi:glycosyltransferase involved in cell wall biosynthesis